MLPHTHSTLINVNSSLLTLVFPCWLKEDRVMMANGIWHFSNLSPKFWYLRTVKNSYIHIQMCTQRELFSFQNLFFKKETIYDKEYKIGEIFYLYLFCYKCLNFPTYIFLYNKDTLFLLSFLKAINVYVVYEATFFLSSLVSSCLCPTTLEILKILKTLSWSSWLGLYATTPAGNLEVKPGPPWNEEDEGSSYEKVKENRALPDVCTHHSMANNWESEIISSTYSNSHQCRQEAREMHLPTPRQLGVTV